MANEPKVSILITAKDLATKVVEGVKSRLTAFGSSVKSVFSGISGVLAGLGIAASGASVLAFLKSSIEEATSAERASLRLSDAVQRLGLSYGELEPKITAYVDAQAKAAGLDNDDVADALATLVTRSRDLTGSMTNLNATLGLAAKEHIDLQHAADIVGRAMAGNTRGLKALGIDTKDATAAMAQLRAVYGGFAEQDAQTFEGMQRRLTVAWGGFLENVGRVIASSPTVREMIVRITAAVEDASTKIPELTRQLELFIAGVRVGVAYYRAAGTVVVGGATVIAGSLVGILARVGLFGNQAILAFLQVLNRFGAAIAQIPGVGKTLGFHIDTSSAEREVAKFRAAVEKTNTAVEDSAFAIRESFEKIGDAQLRYGLAARRPITPAPLATSGGTAGGVDLTGDTSAGTGKGTKEADADRARAKEIATLRELMELRKIDGAGVARLLELQAAVAKEAKAEQERVAAGVGDRERLVALLKQQKDLEATTGMGTPERVQTGTLRPTPATRIDVEASNQGILDEASQAPGDALPDWLKRIQEGWQGVSEEERRANGEAITWGETMLNLGGGIMGAFGSAAQAAFEQIGAGSQSMGKAFGNAVRNGIADAAKAKGRFFFAEGLGALAAGLWPPNPLAIASSAKYFAAAAAMFALGNISGGGGGGGGAGGGAAGQIARGGVDAVAGDRRGTVTVYMPEGATVFDPNDPRAIDLWAQMLGEITDRDVVLRPGSRPR